MTSNRPYLIRAIYEWIVDNGFTPHLVVDANLDEVVVPTRFVEDGKIVLNVSPSSVRGLELGNEFVMFGARFSGSHFEVSFPARAVLAIYARENGKGLAFPPEDDAAGDASQGAVPSPDSPSDEPPDDEPPGRGPEGPPRGGGRPSLRVVK